ncbi:MAG: haloalkane dehalogenase [Gammaproteobacteria bacterium]
MTQEIISTDFPYDSHFVDVYGSKMHYIEEGTGDPILFLHGIPTSSYLWRNVIPHLASLGRCIAPDLIGFGKSDKPDIEYSVFDHIKYIDKFIETLKLDRITLVMHGWGSIVGFDYAMRHEDQCKGLAFYEAYLRPMNGSDLSLPYQEQILSWQGEENVNDLIMNGAHFIEKTLPQGIMRSLSEGEMRYYLEPFKQKGSGKPLNQYLQDLPHGDSQSKVNKLIAEYSKKLIKSSLPKLMLYTVPGFITTIATAMWAKEHLSNFEIADIGEELHYAQESNPELMGETISVWLQGVEQAV